MVSEILSQCESTCSMPCGFVSRGLQLDVINGWKLAEGPKQRLSVSQCSEFIEASVSGQFCLLCQFKSCLKMISCTLPCSDGHCIFFFFRYPPVSYTASVTLWRTKDFCDPLCFKLFNCYHAIESYWVNFTVIWIYQNTFKQLFLYCVYCICAHLLVCSDVKNLWPHHWLWDSEWPSRHLKVNTYGILKQ